MIAFSKTTRASAWLAAAIVLRKKHERVYNLVLEVERPDLATAASRAIEARVDSFLREHGAQPLHTVAETIFPAVEYRTGGLQAVYKYPETVYPVIRTAPQNRWGTYALRLTARRCADGAILNPLELAIQKLKAQLATKAPKRAAYELDAGLEALELKLYSAEDDHSKVRGGQCLSHISLKLGSNRELYLTALYRYQYFGQKALGNLLGLARLQACIAREVGIAVGPLVCHATMAILEDRQLDKAPWDRAQMSKLVDECIALGGDDCKQAGVAA